MRWMIRLLRRRSFWAGNGFLLAAILIVLLGIHFAWPGTVIAMALIALGLVFVAVVAFKMLRSDRASSNIEAGLRAQAERDARSAPPAQRAEIERMNERLSQAIEQLKRSKLAGDGMFKSGKRALYALPWYAIIGPPGAGKTTALINSGLRFPAGTERLAGVGGTRNCDWFLSDRAILLDTAGRYTTEDEDRDEWFAFLDLLKKQRPERPLNGILVAVPLPEILAASPDEREWHAETIRQRMDELAERLGVRLPVYVLFTKTDLVQGFVETFGELDRRERSQVWGTTFGPDEAAGDRAPDAFEHAFDELAEALLAVRNERLQRAQKREDRHRVYAFPLEFGAARDPLSRFVASLFRPNPFQDEPLFRGFYFTSGTQEGFPIDRVMQAMAERLDLPPVGVGFAEPPAEPKSYFLGDVFERVVIPDRGLVRPTGRAVKQRRWAATGLGVASVVGLVLFGLAVSQALVRSRVEMNRAQNAAVEAAAVPVQQARSAGDLAALEALRREADRLRGRPLLQLGLDRRATLREPVRDLYYDRTRALVEATAYADVMQSLRSGGQRAAGGLELATAALDSAAAPDASRTLRRQRVYDDLKAHLLLTTETERLRQDETLREVVAAHLGGLAVGRLVGRDTTGRGAQAELVARQVAAYVDGVAEGRATGFSPEPALVAQARELIYEPPSVAGLYNRIRQEALLTKAPFTLADALPPQYIGMFEPSAQVPGFFTRRAWETSVRPTFERESADPGRDDWVMGREGVALPPGMSDPAETMAALQERYFQDYVRAWQGFLGQVRYREFGGGGATGRDLTTLSSTTDSPLLWLLAVVTEETAFESPSGSNGSTAVDQAAGVAGRVADRVRRRVDSRTGNVLGDAARVPRFGAGGSGETATMHPVSRAFAGIHALNAPDAPTGGAAPELHATLAAYAQLGSALEGLAADPAQAADFAAQVLAQNGGPLAQALQSVENGTRSLDPAVRRTLFVQPVLVAWGEVLGAAQAHLNRRWRDEVHAPYVATLQGRYPLDPRSDADASLGDFERFFAPGSGTMAAFVSEALGPFLTSDGRSARSWQGRGIGLSSTTRDAITQAQRIGEGLFTGTTLSANFELQADVPTREGEAPPPDQVYVRLHGTADSYRMGSFRPWVPVAWPGAPGAEIGLSTRQGALPPVRAEGDWAIFRLLQQADVRRSGSNQLTARWTFRQPGQFALTARYDLRVRTSPAPFAEPERFFRFTCPQSIG